jgi:hypothetical protein
MPASHVCSMYVPVSILAFVMACLTSRTELLIESQTIWVFPISSDVVLSRLKDDLLWQSEGYGNPLQLPYRYTKTSTISTNQNSKFRCIPVVFSKSTCDLCHYASKQFHNISVVPLLLQKNGGSSYRSSMPTIRMKKLADLPTLYYFWFFNSIYHPTAWQIKNPLKRNNS